MAERKHFFDASRAILMFLAIPLHAAVVYAPGLDWLVKSQDGAPAFALLARFIHAFRIEAFFIIAGYFSLVLLRRSGASAYYRGRLLRLGVPLVSCAVLVNAPQELIRFHMAAPEAGWAAAGARLAVTPERWVLHLWFLVDLLIMSGVAALLWRVRERPIVGAVSGWLADVVQRRPAASALVGLPLLGANRVLAEGASVLLGEHRLAFWGLVDLHRVVGHAPLFAFGLLLAARPEVLTRMLRLRRWSPPLAVGSAALAATLADGFGRAGGAAAFMLAPTAAILMAHLLFAITNRLLVRPSRRVQWLAQSSFTVYLVHHPIVAALGLALLGVGASPLAEFAAIVVATSVLAIAVHRVVRGSPVLSFLFNGVAERRAPLAPVTLAGNP